MLLSSLRLRLLHLGHNEAGVYVEWAKSVEEDAAIVLSSEEDYSAVNVLLDTALVAVQDVISGLQTTRKLRQGIYVT